VEDGGPEIDPGDELEVVRRIFPSLCDVIDGFIEDGNRACGVWVWVASQGEGARRGTHR
jgi:hypothetical protein